MPKRKNKIISGGMPGIDSYRSKKDKPKIYERNPDTGVIRWRYVGESPDKFGWPNYGRILNEKKHTRKPARNKSK